MTPKPITENTLFYGDNLPILREHIPDESAVREPRLCCRAGHYRPDARRKGQQMWPVKQILWRYAVSAILVARMTRVIDL